MSEIDDLYFYLFSFCRFKKTFLFLLIQPMPLSGVQKIDMTRDQ